MIKLIKDRRMRCMNNKDDKKIFCSLVFAKFGKVNKSHDFGTIEEYCKNILLKELLHLIFYKSNS